MKVLRSDSRTGVGGELDGVGVSFKGPPSITTDLSEGATTRARCNRQSAERCEFKGGDMARMWLDGYTCSLAMVVFPHVTLDNDATVTPDP